MPRALKTYITNLGFFELAIAAPSMKAALEAWGMSHNAFQQGFARQTGDAEIIAATMAQPGLVLKRAVGTTGAFRQDAALPTSFPDIKPPKAAAPKKRPLKRPKKETAQKSSRAEIISFEKARATREKERAAETAKIEQERAARQRATGVAEAALEKARERHEAKLAEIEEQQGKLEQQAEKERRRWDAEREKLESALERARR